MSIMDTSAAGIRAAPISQGITSTVEAETNKPAAIITIDDGRYLTIVFTNRFSDGYTIRQYSSKAGEVDGMNLTASVSEILNNAIQADIVRKENELGRNENLGENANTPTVHEFATSTLGTAGQPRKT